MLKRGNLAPAGDIPRLNCAVAAGSQEALAVGTKGHSLHRRRLLGPTANQTVRVAVLLGANIPQPHSQVLASRSESSAIGTKGHLPDDTFVALERCNQFSCDGVPNADFAVLISGGQPTVVSTIGHDANERAG